ncbi:MAG: hypothetical protein EPO20_15120 [Betaproteobacteria bacterium]|nr:MAG: hypothetical protein EPO20_15120 [Betaproteobacteria bacterium]
MTATVNHVVGKRIVGERYTPSCGQCDAPPWEWCACSMPLPCNRKADDIKTTMALIAELPSVPQFGSP